MDTSRPQLRNIQAFQDALLNYQPSGHAKQVLARTKFVAVAGLAGGGRNTIINELVKNYNYTFSISDTTRPPKLRDGKMEVDGVNYFFRDEDDVLRDIKSGAYLEAEIIHDQQVSGTSIREIERIQREGKIGISDFEYGGIESVYQAKPDAVIIGLLAPNYDEWLRRFANREHITLQEFTNRLTTAKAVLERFISQPYIKIIVNDTIEQCVQDIRNLVEHGIYTDEMELHNTRVAQAILDNVNEALKDPAATLRARFNV
jgi:guanylate kinase